MTTVPQQAEDVWVVSQTVYGEARGEPEAGQAAVASVILNRQRYHPTWQGETLTDICLAPYQFSCWLPSDPNAALMADLSLDDALFARIVGLVVRVLSGDLDSAVGHSTHYYASSIAPPSWAQGETPCAIIGHHRFFEDIA